MLLHTEAAEDSETKNARVKTEAAKHRVRPFKKPIMLYQLWHIIMYIMRIASLAPSNTEIIYTLGAGDKVVGVTTFCDYPPEAKAKPKLGSWVNIDYEALNDLKPDIVLTSSMVQEKVVARCKDMGLKVLHFDPRTMNDVYDTILQIGDLTYKNIEAQAMVQKMKNRAEEIGKKTEKAKKRPRVYCEEWHKPPFVCGNWIPELIDLAGGESMIEGGQPSREVTKDEVQKFDPHYIILTWCGFKDQARAETVKFREGWEEVYAVKNDRISIFDDSYLNRPGPRLVEGLEMLAKKIHPELF